MSLFITCSHCDNEFTVEDSMYGQTVACPHCEQQIIVETEDETNLERPRLQVKRDALISDSGKPCPSCGGTISKDAVVCVQCGYDFRTGGTHKTDGSPSSLKKLLILLVGVIIVVGIAKSFMDGEKGDTAMPDVAAPPPEQPAPAVEEAPVPEEPAEPDTQVSESAVEETVEEEAEQIDWVALEQRLRERMRSTMDAKQPLFRPGEDIKMRRGSGIIQSGKLMRTTHSEAVILQEGQEVTVPLAELDRATRIRADRDYRERYAQYQVQVMIKKRQQQLAEGASAEDVTAPEDSAETPSSTD